MDIGDCAGAVFFIIAALCFPQTIDAGAGFLPFKCRGLVPEFTGSVMACSNPEAHTTTPYV